MIAAWDIPRVRGSSLGLENGLTLLYAVTRPEPAKHRVAAVQTALADPDQSLRKAAEKALEKAKATAALQGK